jgi:exonuclease III
MIPLIRIQTLNCNGFLQKHKQHELCRSVNENNIDIVCLQETHISTLAIGCEIESRLKCKALWGFGTPRARGVGILIFNYEYEISKFEFDTDGRFMYLDLSIGGRSLRVINIYAPNIAAERRRFFMDLSPFFVTNRDIIFCGDFNCVMDTRIDKVGGNLENGTEGSEEIKSICRDFRLVDYYRVLRPRSVAYTWYFAGNNIGCRLDRIYVSRSMLPSCMHCTVIPYGLSDHDSVMISLDSHSDIVMGKGFWKLNTSILKDKDFHVEFAVFWKILLCGKVITQDSWEGIKSSIKDFIIDYCKRKARAHRAVVQGLHKEYYALVEAERLRPGNYIELIVNIKHRIAEANEVSYAGSKIRSKVNLLNNSERPSKFFNMLESKRGKKGEIRKVTNMDKEDCSTAEDINTAFLDFYASLFTSEGIDHAMADTFTRSLPTLSDSDAELCEGLITIDELREALVSMKNDKSPGPDGISKEFYLTFFPLVGDVLCSVLNLAFENQCMSSSQRLSYITLICKDAENSEALKNWRPISLCCIDYKCLSKVLCNRLSKVLDTIVDVDQTCSIRGRSIHDNVHLLRNITDYVNQKGLKCAFVSLDMEKAFDRVEYSFVSKCLQAYGFGPSFVKWISILYTNISSSVITNGHISHPFPCSRGVRQGCSLSPLLYVLTLEPLLIHIRNNTNVIGFPLPGTTEVAKTTGYADDVTGVVSTVESVGHILDSVSQFGLASGAKLNKDKTKGLFLGAWENREDTPFNINWVKKVKICGVWYGSGFSPDDLWLPIFTKFVNTINLWKSRRLSFTGKTAIANIMGLSKLWYYSSFVTLPPVYLKQFNRVMFKYFWGDDCEPVSRNTLVQNKSQGGFGLVDISSKVKACYLRHIQKLITGYTAKWTYLAIYWVGLSLREHNPAFASNLIPHTLEYTPSFYVACMDVFHSFTSAHPDFVFGTTPTKIFYNHILAPTLIEPRMIGLHPEVNFTRVLSNVHHPFVECSYRDVSWRMIHDDALPVNTLLHRRGRTHIDLCVFRGCLVPETVHHLFFECSYVIKLYDIVLSWLEKISRHCLPIVPGVIPTHLFIYPDSVAVPDKYRQAVCMYIISLVKYVIYLFRNAVKFDRKVISVDSICATFLSLLKFRIKADRQRFSAHLFSQYWLVTDCLCHLDDEDSLVFHFL